MWSIPNFSKLKERRLYSEIFSVVGQKWKLVVYPRGSKADDNCKYHCYNANFTYDIIKYRAILNLLMRKICPKDGVLWRTFHLVLSAWPMVRRKFKEKVHARLSFPPDYRRQECKLIEFRIWTCHSRVFRLKFDRGFKKRLSDCSILFSL